MTTLMHAIACSDIRVSELKLKRIRLCKKIVLETKPSKLRKRNFLVWQSKLEQLIKEETKIEDELQKSYMEIEEFYN